MTDYETPSSEEGLRDLLATLELGTVMARDFDGVIRFWSAGCVRLYGWSAAEAIGRVSHTLLKTVFPVPLAEIEAALLTSGEWTGDLRHTKKDGSEIVVAARKVLRRDARGQPGSVMESLADITAQRQAEDELMRLNADLEARVEAEVAARENIQLRLAQAEKLTALGQLAGGIAHDFNNVIQAVTGAAGRIAHCPEQIDRVRRYAGMIQEASARGAAITGRLLAFSRRDELRPEAVDAGALLTGLHEMLSRTLGTHISVRLALPSGLPCAFVDRRQLETVLINLATNARDAIRDHGSVTLSATPEVIADDIHPFGLSPGDYIRFSVRDDGAGMDEATIRRAREPFFTTKAQGKGTGLGLSMASGFAEQSGGALAIDSRLGLGTTVSLWLPASREAAAATETAAPNGFRALHVLLVDDDELVRDALAGGLADLGFKVSQAASGAEALDLLAEGPDVLVSDYAMPEMDGLALIRRAQRALPRLPALLLTGYDGDVYAALDRASTDRLKLLRKPITGASLAECVASLAAE
ncbi:PAS domain S-box-containing protein [Rhodoblastus acidophilus]|uniref:hybrid sensor histidine kinase/response regulator n=1 Tax=Rhodoblastus acidophilus TaxID=1074 RepID=UPI002224D35C|nr:ATP-binding protein [Rhodoblastus acidophilus]MCW2284122.1 PAS domain S-box-containing protein [Rhodoblastus acidophilus]MCW2332818.1 PAS domain S-box-containing protein [Rhodoblastus acidophilus]